ncbi:MAG: hypothetical protein AAFV36_06295 [Myxococcota bacterium]
MSVARTYGPNPQRRAELRSLAYHREVARRLAHDPSILERARRKAHEWHRMWPTASKPYAQHWLALLDGPRDQLEHVLTSDDSESISLRQTTPFAGVLGARERWRIWREIA